MNNNTLIVGIFAGCMVGFILAMLAGAFGVGTIQSVPAWLQGVFSGLATLVSVYAVYLVSETLQATRDTLNATRIMAEDQRKIGDAQVRAWVLVDKIKVIKDDEGAFLEITLKNFGNTPALNVKALSSLVFWEWVPPDFDQGAVIRKQQISIDRESVLVPASNITFGIPVDTADVTIDEINWVTLEIVVSYRMVHTDKKVEEIIEFDINVRPEGLDINHLRRTIDDNDRVTRDIEYT